MAGQWTDGEVVAWTERDGVARRPKGPSRILPFALVGMLGVVFAGMMSTDTLCPEHRTWVLALGTLGLVGTIGAIVALVQERAIAPLLAVAVSLIGVAIGFIDAIHDPDRGHVVALAFGICALLAIALTVSSLPVALWDRRVRRQLAAAPVTAAPVTAAPDAAMPDSAVPAETPADAREAVLTRPE
jgi:hypothetical protein